MLARMRGVSTDNPADALPTRLARATVRQSIHGGRIAKTQGLARRSHSTFPVRWVALALAMASCNAVPVTAVETEHSTESSVTTCYGEWPKVDALLVVDGSPSMADKARLVAQAGAEIGSAYARREVTVNYRVAVIDSQVPQPGCIVEPDLAGRFIDTSCRERLDDFVTEASIEGSGADVRAEGCTDVCQLETLTTLPSAATGDRELRPRPWIESTHHITNLPDGIEVSDDLGCRFPTGVAGCTFEAPLEAMRAALERTQDPDDPAYGFLRPDAVLFVMFVTDEVDCSLRADIDSLTEAFGPDAPTSSACWDAGVRCQGQSPYAGCDSIEDSVLQPLDDYARLLSEINADKLERMPGLRSAVVVSAVTGVDVDQTVHYADVADAEWMDAFGIGPGCESEHGKASPPVRLRELTEEFGERAQWGESSTFTMCHPGWSSAIACFPGPDVSIDPCVNLCLADVDPETPELEVDCRVEWTDPAGKTEVLPACASQSPWLPADAEACAHVLGPADNTHRCAERGTFEFIASFGERGASGCMTFVCQTAPQDVCDRRDYEVYFPPQ